MHDSVASNTYIYLHLGICKHFDFARRFCSGERDGDAVADARRSAQVAQRLSEREKFTQMPFAISFAWLGKGCDTIG